jgi:type IX secretion system PorP/SprF family membrane protein
LKIAGLKIAIIVVAAVFFLLPEAGAQDIHFTQVQATPLLINPASTGISDYDFRLVCNYRNQWRTLEKPYNTYSISADTRLFIGKQAIGMGAFLVHDLSMGDRLITDKFYFSISYSRFFRNHQVIIGAQPGLTFRNINLDDITFNSQFNSTDGRFSSSLPSYENLLSDRLSYFDCNAGLLWRTRIKDYQLAAGFSVDHLNRPVESFMKGPEDEHLPLRYNLHGNILIPLTERMDMIPLILYNQTSGAHELVAGSILGYSFADVVRTVTSAYTLALLRINPVANFDALMLGAGIQVFKFDLCVSYDLNISGLHKATNFYGAFEISLIYRNIHTRSGEAVKPCYML